MLKIASSAGYPEINVLMVTLVLLSIAFVLIVIVRREFFSINRERAIFILITCLLGYVIPLLAGIYAAPHIKAGVLILVISLTPMVSIAIWNCRRNSEALPKSRPYSPSTGLFMISEAHGVTSFA